MGVGGEQGERRVRISGHSWGIVLADMKNPN